VGSVGVCLSQLTRPNAARAMSDVAAHRVGRRFEFMTAPASSLARDPPSRLRVTRCE
jgi:hypothetical protein